ncbi:hypothetical protein ACFWYW_56980 [Nonomuraea sp. NPDC059023]|uniref:hypothetical protein n=1 Tax=unclassified Nonomuraea TaxID=2593643 RepID=UPI0036AC5822
MAPSPLVWPGAHLRSGLGDRVLARGLSNAEIALLGRLGPANRMQAAILTLEHGLITTVARPQEQPAP